MNDLQQDSSTSTRRTRYFASNLVNTCIGALTLRLAVSPRLTRTGRDPALLDHNRERATCDIGHSFIKIAYARHGCTHAPDLSSADSLPSSKGGEACSGWSGSAHLNPKIQEVWHQVPPTLFVPCREKVTTMCGPRRDFTSLIEKILPTCEVGHRSPGCLCVKSCRVETESSLRPSAPCLGYPSAGSPLETWHDLEFGHQLDRNSFDSGPSAGSVMGIHSSVKAVQEPTGHLSKLVVPAPTLAPTRELFPG
jgi:hypothetical protein